jgi:hypothetical protein
MRTKLVAILVGCGLVAATIAPAFACDYKTQAANDTSPPQQTAQTQQPDTQKN